MTNPSTVDTPEVPVLDAPATDVAAVDETPTPATGATFQLTEAQLNGLLARAVEAGRLQAPGQTFAPGVAVDAEAPAVWSKSRLLHELVRRTPWFDERADRAATLAVNTHYPIDEED